MTTVDLAALRQQAMAPAQVALPERPDLTGLSPEKLAEIEAREAEIRTDLDSLNRPTIQIPGLPPSESLARYQRAAEIAGLLADAKSPLEQVAILAATLTGELR